MGQAPSGKMEVLAREGAEISTVKSKYGDKDDNLGARASRPQFFGCGRDARAPMKLSHWLDEDFSRGSEAESRTAGAGPF